MDKRTRGYFDERDYQGIWGTIKALGWVALVFAGTVSGITIFVSIIMFLSAQLDISCFWFLGGVLIFLFLSETYRTGALRRYIEALFRSNKEITQPGKQAKRQEIYQERAAILQESESRKALTAMRRANMQLSTVSFILTDTGLLVYEDEEHSPYLSREKSLPLDTDLIRPFIEIWSEFWDTFPISLEILDDKEQLLFEYRTSQELKHKTYIIADTWISVKDMERGGNPRWSLRVKVDDELVAVHYIKWGSFRWKDIPYQAMTDGEMDKRTSRLMDHDLLTSMSLDDLLAE